MEQSSGTVWQHGGGGEGWRSHLPDGGCWIERRWRRCRSVGVIGWERGGQPRVGGRRGDIVWVRGMDGVYVGVVCVCGGGRVDCRFVAVAGRGGGGSVVGWGGGGG